MTDYRELTLVILRLVERVRTNPSLSSAELSQQIAQALQGQQLSSLSPQALPANSALTNSERWEYLSERVVYCTEAHPKEEPPWWMPGRMAVNARSNPCPRMYPVGWKFNKKQRGFERMLVFKCPKCNRCCGLTLHNGRVVPVFQHGQIKVY